MKIDKKLLRLLPGYDPFAQAEGFHFDADEAANRIAFIQECCVHIEGSLSGKPFILEPWQQSYVANLFGWKKPDGSRRYRESLLYVPRKNGKTPLAAAIAISVLFQDHERGAQSLIGAADTDQAALCFRHVRGMIEAEPEFNRRCKVYKGFKSIEIPGDNSFLKVISSDANTKHGGNLHFIIVDELHAQKGSDLVDVLETATTSKNRTQPILLLISTADFDRPSVCNEKLAYARSVRDNGGDKAKPGFDPAFLPAIWEASKDDDWTGPEVWAKTNPNLGVSVSEEALARLCQKAKETPRFQNTFKRLHLNIVTEQADRWINLERWDECSAPVDREDLRGQRCYMGIDLSSNTDLTAVVLYFPDSCSVLPYFWVPGDNVRLRVENDRVPYDVWQRQGLLEFTEGDTIDERRILSVIDEIADTFELVEIGVDRWGGRQIINRLLELGLEVVSMPQTPTALNGGMLELERLYLGLMLRHGGNPVLRWNAANLAVSEDHDGHMKPSKKHSFERIDGMSALVNALCRAVVEPEEKASVYENWHEVEAEIEAEAKEAEAALQSAHADLLKRLAETPSPKERGDATPPQADEGLVAHATRGLSEEEAAPLRQAQREYVDARLKARRTSKKRSIYEDWTFDD